MASARVAVDVDILFALVEGHEFTHQVVKKLKIQFGDDCLVAPQHVLSQLRNAVDNGKGDLIADCAQKAWAGLDVWKIAKGRLEGKAAPLQLTTGVPGIESFIPLVMDAVRLDCRLLLSIDVNGLLDFAKSNKFRKFLKENGLPENFRVISPRDVIEIFR